jgi:hypothetical protein
MLGYCGLDCTHCEAYIATANNDDAHRARIAEQWTKQYGASIELHHINCTGCTGSGVKLNYCESMCAIRKCAVERAVATCAECADYPCATLDPLLKAVPQARENLESRR